MKAQPGNSARLALLLAALVLNLSVVRQAEAAFWTSHNPMTSARHNHTETLLRNGQVLVAGGIGSLWGGASATAELYNPATRTWTATGALNNNARNVHTATLLPNGQVLVAGGRDGSGVYLSSTALYDPATRTWMATGTMKTARYNHTATLLPNGQVLVAGGILDSGSPASTEMYDPSTTVSVHRNRKTSTGLAPRLQAKLPV